MRSEKMSTRAAIVAAAVLCLLFVTGVQAGFVNSGQRYYVMLKGGRSACSSANQYLGFVNRTCPGAGPVLRAESTGKSWRQWVLTKTGETKEGYDLVHAKTYYPAGRFTRCIGNMATSTGSRCTNDASKKPSLTPDRKTTWRIVPVPGDASYQIIVHYERKGATEPCNRFLTVSPVCSNTDIGMVTGDDGSRRQRWTFLEVNPSAPVVTAAASAGTTSAKVTFRPTMGATSCTVRLSPGGKTVTVSKLTMPTSIASFTGLTAATKYTASTTCRTPSGTSPVSNSRSFTTGTTGTRPVIVGVSASGPTAGNVHFVPTPGASSCKVTLSPGGASVVVSTITKPYSVANFQGLTAGTRYTATAQCGSSPLSNSLSLATPANTGVPQIANAKPLSPTRGSFTIVKPANVNPVKYSITYRPTAGGAAKTIEVDADQLDVLLTGLTPSTEYEIVITGILADGSKTGPSAPGYLITPNGNGSPGEGQVPVEVSASASSPTEASVFYAPPAGAKSCTTTLSPGSIKTTVSALTEPYSAASFKNLTPNTRYSAVTVCVMADGTQSTPSNTMEFVTPANLDGRPALINAKPLSPTTGSFTIVPPANVNPVKYSVTYVPTSGGTPRTIEVDADELNVLLTGLTPDTEYQVVATGILADGSKTQPTNYGYIVTPAGPADAAPVPVITDATAKSPTSGSVTFRPAAGATSCTTTLSPGGATQTVNNLASSNTVDFTGLTADTTYTAVTQCTMPDGTISTQSNYASFTTREAGPPVLLTAGSVTGETAVVTFTPASGATACVVTLSPGGKTVTVSPVSDPVSTANFSGLQSSTTYNATATCTLANGSESPASNYLTFTTPGAGPAPVLKTAEATGFNSGTVTFEPTPGADVCWVTLSPGGITTRVSVLVFPVSTADFGGLSPATTYTATAICQMPDGTISTPSNTQSFTTPGYNFVPLPPAAPSGSPCDGRGELIDANGNCYCDSANKFIPRPAGGCQCDDAAGFIDPGQGSCECNADKFLVPNSSGGCQCDASKFLRAINPSRVGDGCECDASKGRVYDPATQACVCDAAQLLGPYSPDNGSCQCLAPATMDPNDPNDITKGCQCKADFYFDTSRGRCTCDDSRGYVAASPTTCQCDPFQGPNFVSINNQCECTCVGGSLCYLDGCKCPVTDEPLFFNPDDGPTTCGTYNYYSVVGGKTRVLSLKNGATYSLEYDAYTAPDRYIVRDAPCGQILADTNFVGQTNSGCTGSAPCCNVDDYGAASGCVGTGGSCANSPGVVNGIADATSGGGTGAGLTPDFVIPDCGEDLCDTYITGMGGCGGTAFEWTLKGAGGGACP